MYLLAKSLHLVGMVSWMAGVFYLVRIMVYHAEALQAAEPERSVLSTQFAVMEGRVYRIILVPAIWITWSFGSMMLAIQPIWLSQGWMHIKLLLLVLFSLYTHGLKGHIRSLAIGNPGAGHLYYRALNEVPTVLLLSIVLLAVYRGSLNYWLYGAGLLAFIGLVALGLWRVNRKPPNPS
jgi:putative membrane protein